MNIIILYKTYIFILTFANRLIQIRNCIMHSNSLTILLEYYNVKEKSFRKSSDRKAYQKIVKELLKLKKDNYF